MSFLKAKYTAESLSDIAKEFRAQAEGARMAMGVSTIRTNSKRYAILAATARTWEDAARVIESTTLQSQDAPQPSNEGART